MILGSLKSKAGGKRVGPMATMKPNQQDLIFVKELLEAGKVKPVIDRSYPLAEVPDALRYLETGRAQGKVVITVA
jgi:NADPH:quinone reductase-like Zn-dependent oxidoreductase